jgi:uncharacterized membrane protein
MRILLSLAALTAITFAGCQQSSEGGTPGTKANFKLEGPVTGETIKQGEQDTIKLSINRGSDFKKDVKLKAEAPDKIKAELSKPMIKASEDTEFTMTVSVDKDAPIGDHIVKVTGTPEGGGSPTHLDVKVKVDKP